MVSPIIRNPDHDPEEEVKRLSEQKRKAPPKDFNEALEQIDARRQQDDSLNKELKGLKKIAVRPFLKKKESEAAAPLLSPFDLARGVKRANEEEGEEKGEEVNISIDDIAEVPAKTLPKMKETVLSLDAQPISTKKMSPFEAVEQHDIDMINPQGYVPTYVPPPALTSSAPQVTISQAPPTLVPRPIHEIMNEIVKEIDVLQTEGKTETRIELKGTFEHSNLIITQFDSDKNAMNITIDNLTAANQQLLDSHKATLIKNLDDINIHVHIFIASSSIELNPTTLTKLQTGQQETKERNFRDGRRQNPDREA